MSQPVQWCRSLIFDVQMYLAMAVLGIWYAPQALWSRDRAFAAVHTYCRYVRWTASWMLGLRSEVRGEVPTGEVMIAAKHQSFFDIILLVSVLPRPKFIMKKELTRAPVLGWFALRIGCVPVDRGRRGAAIQQMLRDVDKGLIAAGQLIIYPQGTRVAPGATPPYKTGTAVLYQQLNHACVPVAVNVGVFWPRRGILKKPGLAVIEFLDPIPPGMEKGLFALRLQEAVENGSNALMEEAGWRGPDFSL